MGTLGGLDGWNIYEMKIRGKGKTALPEEGESMALIEAEHLVKEYKRKIPREGMKGALYHMFHPEYETFKAVNDISFSVEEGEAVGYIGPNGSGKSTTIKMLTGILTPTAGTIRVNGRIPTKERIKNNRDIGVVTGNRSLLFWDVPVIESFKLFQKMYEIPDAVYRDNLEKFTELLGLVPLLSLPERQLSLGQKMRCNITAAFLHDPKIVYLDEPTIGLDTSSKNRIRSFIRQVNEEKKTTFIITSHDFRDIEALCKRIILINHGKKIVDDQIENVRKEFERYKNIRFEVEDNWKLKTGGYFMPGVKLSFEDHYYVDAEYELEKTEAKMVIDFVSQYCQIKDISITGRAIEAIIEDILTTEEK